MRTRLAVVAASALVVGACSTKNEAAPAANDSTQLAPPAAAATESPMIPPDSNGPPTPTLPPAGNGAKRAPAAPSASRQPAAVDTVRDSIAGADTGHITLKTRDGRTFRVRRPPGEPPREPPRIP